MNFIDIILKEMEKQRISAYKLCKDLGMSQQTFSNWKNGKIPALDKAVSIIIYLGLSADEIFNIKTTELSAEEKELLKFFRQLPESEQMRELGRLEEKAEQIRNQQERSSCSRSG